MYLSTSILINLLFVIIYQYLTILVHHNWDSSFNGGSGEKSAHIAITNSIVIAFDQTFPSGNGNVSGAAEKLEDNKDAELILILNRRIK
jgi:hypothetical protein